MTFRERMSVLRSKAKTVCFWLGVILVAEFILSPIWITEWINLLGPSTSYFDQRILSAVPGPDKQPTIYVGDDLTINARTIRHSLNGSCILEVWRVRQNIGGPRDGDIHLLQHAPSRPGQPIEQGPFIGYGFYRNTEWPIAPERIKIDDDWIPKGEKTQVVDIFVVARYLCNFIDYVIPRWLTDADGVNAEHDPDLPNVPRNLIGFKIRCWYTDRCWDEDKHRESGHVRVVVARRKQGI